MKQEFIWGAASASYQIEGGVFEDGRGSSVWDVFSHTPGKVKYDENGDVACDSYHRFEEDLDILKDLGIQNYRFSISWPRVLPCGTGEVNPKGLAYYDKVVNGCLARGITPWITIYHWDHPQELEDRYGGWRSPQIVDDFAEYAVLICRHFGDRVKNYFIMNEPQCFITNGYKIGLFAPGLTLPSEEYALCWKHMLLAYGKAVSRIRAEVQGLSLGIASTGNVWYPAEETAQDIEAARELTFTMHETSWLYNHFLFLDPICLGTLPDCTGTEMSILPELISDEEMQIIYQKPDFVGLNIYHGMKAAMNEEGKPVTLPDDRGCPRTAFKWVITPSILHYTPLFAWERYHLPIFISENGMSNNDFIYEDGKVHDPQRIHYLSSYIGELMKAKADGADIAGYFQWSILDNFEWASGYDERFGLVYVDYQTGNRVPKDSAYWYADYIKKHGGE